MAIYKRPAHFKVAIDNAGKTDNELFNEASFSIELEPHPDLVELFAKNGFSRRGRYTWIMRRTPENREKFKDFYHDYAENFTPYTLHAGDNERMILYMTGIHRHYLAQPSAFATGIKNDSDRRYLKETARQFFNYNIVSDALADPKLNVLVDNLYRCQVVDRNGSEYKNSFSPAYLVMSAKENFFYVRLKISNNDWYFDSNIEDSPFYGGKKLNNYVNAIPSHVVTPNAVSLDIVEFFSVVNALQKNFNMNIFTSESKDIIADCQKRIVNTLFVAPAPGDPNKVRVLNPSEKEVKLFKNGFTKQIHQLSIKTMSLNDILRFEDNDKDVKILVHPMLFDIQNMINAQEYNGEDRLYGYQRRAVGLHLSTDLGYVNSLDTGIGKSIVQSTAMRERSKRIDNYRGLIVCQSNTKKQWKEYLKDDAWFPEAEVVIVDSNNKTNQLVNALGKEGPVVVIATFNIIGKIADVLDRRKEIKDQAKDLKDDSEVISFVTQAQNSIYDDLTVANLLVDMYWDDICADEATSIRNGSSSQQSQALWHLRQNSEIATALTATPLNKSLADIENLLSWVRKNRKMFYGASLTKHYDVEKLTQKQAKKIFDSLYPMIFRFTKEEASKEEKEIKIPEELMPETLLLKPSPAELALSQTCEFELKRILDEFEIALNNYEANSDAEKQKVEEAREQLREAHGHWLSGTNIARMATSDPSSILKSKSLAAQLLIGQGLVQNAMNEIPTKQRELLKRIPAHVEKGQQILVFTDFVQVAESLAQALDTIGIRSGVFGGSNLKKRDENRIAFQNGDLDVLVCTKAAERGLTLHRASVVYHYDISWTLEPLLQKAGRAARVGSENDSVETYFLILQGTIEEKVVDKVFNQGTSSSLILDKSRGVNIKNTTTGKLMGGLTKASSNINTRKGALEFGKELLNA